MKFFLLYEEILYEIEENGNIKNIPYNKTEEIKEYTSGGICLYDENLQVDKNCNFIIQNYEDENYQSKNDIYKEMTNQINVFNIDLLNILETQHDNNTIYFFIRKLKLETLFKNFEFSKIYPLNFILFYMGGEITGFINENLSLIKQFKTVQDLAEGKFFIGQNSDTQFTFEKYLNSDKKKSIIGDINLDNIENETIKQNLEIFNIKNLKVLCNKYKHLSFSDKYSLHYQSKKIKPFLIIMILIFLSIGSYSLINYIKTLTIQTIYETKNVNLENDITKLKKDIKTYKSKNILAEYSPLYLKEHILKIENLLKKYYIKNYELEIINKNKKMIAYIKIISNDKNIQNIMKNEKYTQIKMFKKDNELFEIEILLDLNKGK